MVRNRAGWFLGGTLVLAGAALLGAALFSPWYFYNVQRGEVPGSGGGGFATRNAVYFLDPLTGGGPVQYSCSGTSVANFCPLSTTYSDAGLNNSGMIATVVFVLASAGFVLGIAGGIAAITGRKARWTTAAVILAMLALVLGVSASASFYSLLPGSFANAAAESQLRPYANYTGPWSSFSGTTPFTNPAGFSITSSWGPSIGWYLSIAAAGAFLAGAVLLTRYRRLVGGSVHSAGLPNSVPPATPNSPESTK